MKRKMRKISGRIFDVFTLVLFAGMTFVVLAAWVA